MSGLGQPAEHDDDESGVETQKIFLKGTISNVERQGNGLLATLYVSEKNPTGIASSHQLRFPANARSLDNHTLEERGKICESLGVDRIADWDAMNGIKPAHGRELEILGATITEGSTLYVEGIKSEDGVVDVKSYTIF